MKKYGILLAVVLICISAVSQVGPASMKSAPQNVLAEMSMDAAPLASVQSVMTGRRTMLA